MAAIASDKMTEWGDGLYTGHSVCLLRERHIESRAVFPLRSNRHCQSQKTVHSSGLSNICSTSFLDRKRTCRKRKRSDLRPSDWNGSYLFLMSAPFPFAETSADGMHESNVTLQLMPILQLGKYHIKLTII